MKGEDKQKDRQISDRTCLLGLHGGLFHSSFWQFSYCRQCSMLWVLWTKAYSNSLGKPKATWCNYSCLPNKLLHLTSLSGWQGSEWTLAISVSAPLQRLCPWTAEEVLLAWLKSFSGLNDPIMASASPWEECTIQCSSPEVPQLINAVREKNGPGSQISLSEPGWWHRCINSPVTSKDKAMLHRPWLLLHPLLCWAAEQALGNSTSTLTLALQPVCAHGVSEHRSPKSLSQKIVPICWCAEVELSSTHAGCKIKTPNCPFSSNDRWDAGFILRHLTGHSQQPQLTDVYIAVAFVFWNDFFPLSSVSPESCCTK